ncbi:MAG: hypothetical protein SGBAC_006487 [Bacillariaceae sp.]
MSRRANDKNLDNGAPQVVPVIYATVTSNQDQQDVSEAQPISHATIQVIDIDESQTHQQAQQQAQPLHQPLHQPPTPSAEAEIDPNLIQIVTFDEQPTDTDVTNAESTPLLQQSGHTTPDSGVNPRTTNDPQFYDVFDDETTDGGAECHDLIWAVLFYGHIAVVLYAGTQLAPQGYTMMENDSFDLQKLHDLMQAHFVNDDDFTAENLDQLTHFLHEFQAWWAIYTIRIAWFSWGMAIVSFFINLVKNIVSSRTICFVSSSLVVFGIILGLFLMIVFSDKGFFGFVVAVVLIGLLAAYIRKRLWPKIQFVALNLEIALAGIGNNLGTYVWVIACAKLTLAYIAFWCYTVLGLMEYVTNTKCPDLKWDFESKDNDTCGATNVVLLGLCLSLYWTLSHVSATIQVYVAGVMVYFKVSASFFDQYFAIQTEINIEATIWCMVTIVDVVALVSAD